MRPSLPVFALVLASACSELREAGPGDGGAPGPSDGAAVGDGGPQPVPAGDGSVQVTVETLVTGRSRLGARSTAGFRPWRSGIAVAGDQVFWVESGTQPGLYASSSSSPCTSASCVQKIATFARPSAFTSTATHVYVADTTVIKRFAFAGGNDTVASSTGEVVNLAADATAAFWTFDTNQDMQKTVPGGVTNAMIRSNGTPVAMAVAGDSLFWAGVDISGQTVAMQTIKTNGTGAREVVRSSNGFHTMRGNGSYLYYAENTPAAVHRLTLNSGRNEVVDRDAYGVTDFAVDDSYAYWVEPGDAPDYLNGRVRRIAHDSQSAQTLAVSVAFPVAVAVSGKKVFVASAGTKAASYADGAILRLSIAE